MKQVLPGVLAVALMLGTGQVRAADPTLAEIRAQQLELHEKLAQGDASLAALSATERAQLQAAQERVFGILEGHSDADRLHPAQRTQLTNELERINALVQGDDRNRLVCKREKRTGSQRYVRVCKTVSERELELQNSQRLWDRTNVCNGGVGCSN